MGNNKEGGQKAKATKIAKWGGEAAYRKRMQEFAKRKRPRGGTGGFAFMKKHGQADKIRQASLKGAEARKHANQETSDGSDFLKDEDQAEYVKAITSQD